MEFESLPEFKKDLKKLLKRFRTLENDIEDVKKVLSVRPEAHPPFSFKIDGLGIESCVIKVKKIASDSLKGKGSNSGLRLIYAYFQTDEKIVFVELYYKNDKENEDRGRILKHFK
jgi:mRNA-degrading endonuclease RelE of RelBE toxin-antitoxin system